MALFLVPLSISRPYGSFLFLFFLTTRTRFQRTDPWENKKKKRKKEGGWDFLLCFFFFVWDSFRQEKSLTCSLNPKEEETDPPPRILRRVPREEKQEKKEKVEGLVKRESQVNEFDGPALSEGNGEWAWSLMGPTLLPFTLQDTTFQICTRGIYVDCPPVGPSHLL